MSASPDAYRDFADLYAEVTVVLTQFAKHGRGEGRISDDELNWFVNLIQRFTVEFCNWDSLPAGPVRDYLALFEEAGVSRPLRLAAHAFLHVAYDLPRAIADSLSATPLPRASLRPLFVRPAPLFRQIFAARARRGSFGFLARPLGYIKAAEILGYWLLSLRSVAWIHAEVLVDALDRPTLEGNLAQGLFDAGQAAREFNGVFGVPKLDNSTLFQVAPPLVIPVHYPTAAIATALLVTLALLRVRNEVISNQLTYFGTRVYIQATKAIGAGKEPVSKAS